METAKTIKELELEINQITPTGCLYLGNALSPRNMVPIPRGTKGAVDATARASTRTDFVRALLAVRATNPCYKDFTSFLSSVRQRRCVR